MTMDCLECDWSGLDSECSTVVDAYASLACPECGGVVEPHEAVAGIA